MLTILTSTSIYKSFGRFRDLGLVLLLLGEKCELVVFLSKLGVHFEFSAKEDFDPLCSTN